MTKAVLDSSVLVSAFLKPGSLPATLLTRAREGAFSLVLSSYVIQETAAVLVRPKHQASRSFTPDEVARYCRDLLAVGDLPNVEAVPDDPKDDPIVATALAGRADYLVTGDKAHLLPLKEYQGIRIVSPREFVELL